MPSRAYVVMEPDRAVCFTPVDHLDARVQRAGFDLTDPYVEQCWSAAIGPSSTLLLRRLPALWVARVTAAIDASEFSQSLGLGAGVNEHSRLVTTLLQLVRFGFANPASDDAGFDVYGQVAPLNPRQLARLPKWTQDTHERLFGAHIEQLDHGSRHQASVASITARMDRLQYGTGHNHPRAEVRSGARSMSLTRRPGSPGTPVSPHAHVTADRQVRRAHIDRFPSGEPVGPPVDGLR
jgi:hypothetical protein